MIGNQHKVAFYADIFYNSELSPAYWTPPANLDVDAVPNTTWLDDETVVLPGGLRIIGSTLWSAVAEGDIDRCTEMLAGHGLKGVDDIRTGGRYLTLRDTNELIAEAGPRYWLCGHAHTTHQVTIGATHVESNPRAGDGPGHVNPEFAESYVVEL